MKALTFKVHEDNQSEKLFLKKDFYKEKKLKVCEVKRLLIRTVLTDDSLIKKCSISG